MSREVRARCVVKRSNPGTKYVAASSSTLHPTSVAMTTIPSPRRWGPAHVRFLLVPAVPVVCFAGTRAWLRFGPLSFAAWLLSAAWLVVLLWEAA